MTHYQTRRQELIGARKRKMKRQAAMARWNEQKRLERVQRSMATAFRRLERVL